MIRTIDDFLIDRLFQPICDSIARWVSCYSLAAFLLTGFGLADLAYRTWRGDFVDLIFLAVWWPIATSRAYNLAQSRPSSVLSVERVRDVYCRVPFLCVVIIGVVTSLGDGNRALPTWMAAAWLLVPTALYLMACRYMPPPKRETHRTWWLGRTVPSGAA